MLKKIVILSSITALSVSSFAAHAGLIISQASNQPHFYVQMANQSDKDTTISFKQTAGTGKITLTPTLPDHTPLAAHQQTSSFGVSFDPFGSTDQFEIIFSGKQDCAFNVAFFAPRDPLITISGYGCAGGGYTVSGDTLTLYIANIHTK